jgi:hypothetical protein
MVVSRCSLGMVGYLVVGVNGQVTFAISGIDMTHFRWCLESRGR